MKKKHFQNGSTTWIWCYQLYYIYHFLRIIVLAYPDNNYTKGRLFYSCNHFQDNWECISKYIQVIFVRMQQIDWLREIIAEHSEDCHTHCPFITTSVLTQPFVKNNL